MWKKCQLLGSRKGFRFGNKQKNIFFETTLPSSLDINLEISHPQFCVLDLVFVINDTEPVEWTGPLARLISVRHMVGG